MSRAQQSQPDVTLAAQGDTPTRPETEPAIRPRQIDNVREGASESSDEGVRMSPAAARRFARRNFRRTAVTPDLVTSLVRPPSPEAVYIARDAHGRLGHAIPQPLGVTSHPYGRRHPNAAPDRRTGPLLPPHQSSLDIPKKYGGDCVFDMYSLSYISVADPNLLCPICHDPLVDPITTPCDHTFCYRCLRRSIASSPSGTACPIDRELLSWLDCFSAARLVRTQLDGLIVKCPNQGRGCDEQMRRENVERHAALECRFREYMCPDASCDKKLRRKPRHDDCQHKEVCCALCDAKVEEAEEDAHLLICPEAKTRCEACWQLVCRSQLDIHHSLECDGMEIACPYDDLGCPVRVMRGEMSAHSFTCAFHPDTASGIVIRNQRALLQSHTNLSGQLRDMRLRQDEVTKRVEDLAASQQASAELRNSQAESVISDKRTIQDLDAGFEEVHQNLTHLEARQSMWTLNQVMPIREEVTELRNNINMIRMHVNWLLNRSREEGRIRAANTAGPAAGIRRDSSGEEPPVLSERRRSSGTDMDVPRL